jgi:hypothetical protein
MAINPASPEEDPKSRDEEAAGADQPENECIVTIKKGCKETIETHSEESTNRRVESRRRGI